MESANNIEPQNLETKDTFPKKIHFIWIGGSIPKEYLNTIHQVSIMGLENDFQVNVWVDKDSNITKMAERNVLFDKDSKITEIVERMDIPISNIKLRNISEIMNSNLIDAEHDKSFNKYLQMEMSGSMKNLAAAADLLRYAILLKEGGMYLDADTRIKAINCENSVQDLGKEWLDASINQYGFASVKRYKHDCWEGGNDMLACKEGNEIIKDVLKEFVDGYVKNEQEIGKM